MTDAQVKGRVFGIETPFPLEELYVPVLAIAGFFAAMVVLGQLLIRVRAVWIKKEQ
jgi:hypothetical protein